MFIIYVIVYATWCFIGGEEKSPFVLLFDSGGFLIITHLFLLPFCQFPNFEHFESKQNEKREKFNRYFCEKFAFGYKRLNRLPDLRIGYLLEVRRTVRTPNSSFRANSPNTEQTEHPISSEQSEHRTVRTPKILKKSEQVEQSEQLLFGLWWTLPITIGSRLVPYEG